MWAEKKVLVYSAAYLFYKKEALKSRHSEKFTFFSNRELVTRFSGGTDGDAP